MKARKNLIINIVKKLINMYPDANCSLNYTTPYSLVVSLILAAQCTDDRVNKTTPVFFNKFNNIEEVALSNIKDIEKIIRSCGFYKNKAKNILLCSQKIISDFNGIVPDNMKDLCSLPGIGRKSANVILQECYNKVEGIVVDTHVTRIANRLGMTESKNTVIIEKDIMAILPKKYWHYINHILVFHGRAICNARNPKCNICPIKDMCEFYKSNK